ncbi:FAD-dependent oxidoreductase [Candidatus Synechococcus calcipolaris G9]|uniref:FAD-dependent oxidoreductase n=1 Tax=Candidatus Synechococcus calcipolaris G9 TaxID=1497997 RepID=A0ABT6F1V4_9SYNE|nr:FAD-dependent oxidoreductase [Candidatus Synechococcus calcipolaris]MDG2991756.1 FAD-dependent oxidoreductase [Candidatus Synechococcus calcipolaris G9]
MPVSTITTIKTDVLVVGGGTGGVAAALQSAQMGAKTILVSEFPWLGGMLTSAGVAAPDGHELRAWQTGLWGEFLRALERAQPGGLDHSWVSFFSYDPAVGAQIFADWVHNETHLQWIPGQIPRQVLRQGDRIGGVVFDEIQIQAQITLDGTELGDLLALADIPHRWGWEWQSAFQEPSAPIGPNHITQTYPVQAPTWVVILQDYNSQNGGSQEVAPEIPPSPLWDEQKFKGAWDAYGPEQFMNYGRLPGDRFMINWPHQGNDYGQDLDRLVESPQKRREFFQEARWHSQDFARYIQIQLGQTQLGRRYGLATGVFPTGSGDIGGGAFALHPYFRESRRLIGVTTLTEWDILPQETGRIAPLPRDEMGQYTGVAIANYANDHHYPGFDFKLAPKSIRWGGRWTGTPFVIPHTCLIPAGIEGFLVCDKNISVSHIANGATRLQPAVLGIGQAAGLLAAIAVLNNQSVHDVPVQALQRQLIQTCQQTIFPFFNLTPSHPQWRSQQEFYLNGFANLEIPLSGDIPLQEADEPPADPCLGEFSGRFCRKATQDYYLETGNLETEKQPWQLVTLRPDVDIELSTLRDGRMITLKGIANPSGNWIRVELILKK